jgi:hypothetical protein
MKQAFEAELSQNVVGRAENSSGAAFGLRVPILMAPMAGTCPTEIIHTSFISLSADPRRAKREAFAAPAKCLGCDDSPTRNLKIG